MNTAKLKIISGISAVVFFAAVIYILTPVISVNLARKYAGVDISYDRWEGNPVFKSRVEGLTLRLEGSGIIVRADGADLDVDFGLRRFFSDRTLKVACDMKGVSFSVPRARPSSEAGADLLALSFSPEVKYEDISFKVNYTRENVYLYDFSADSESIIMSGSYNYFRHGDYLELLLNISVSPELYNALPEQIRTTALTPQEDGWYGTVIDIKAPWKVFQFMSSLPAGS